MSNRAVPPSDPGDPKPPDEYALDDLDDAPPRRAAPILPDDPPAERRARSARPSRSDDSPSPKPTPRPTGPEPAGTVDQVWSRGAEWGETIVKLVVAALVLLGLLYFLFSAGRFGLAFLTLLLSGPILVAIAYPILITLERPVRITPEQAVNDFFAAVSHHVPHYRRMWLLLSDSGRISGSFSSFQAFRAYWKMRLAELRSGHAGGFTPLKFQVLDFHAAKSAGLSHIEAAYVVQVFVRGQQDGGPIQNVKVAMSLVKGPDRMWYLNKGTFP